MHIRPRQLRRATATLITCTVALSTVGCSLIEDDDATVTPTTIVAPKVVETTQLEAILPSAADFGPEFVVGEPEIMSGSDDEPDDEPDDEIDKAFDSLEDDCPGVEEAFDSPGELVHLDSEEDAVRGFTAPDGRSYAVFAASDPDNVLDALDREEMAARMRDIDLCPSATAVDADTGLTATITLNGKVVDDLGEWGVNYSLRVAMAHPNLPAPVIYDLDILLFGVGSVALGIMTLDGLDDTTMRVTEADLGRRDVVAANLSMMAAAVQMAAPADPSGADPAAGSQPAAP